MPIQFSNGNQIVHHYDAMGNRLETTYYTRKVPLVEPACGILQGTNNLQEYNIVSYAMLGNKRYVRHNNNPWTLDMVMNDEGYTRYYGPEEHYSFYYIKDHLGNVHETYVSPEPHYKECVQRMQYYPSGLPWDTNQSASEQPFKYCSKEFIEMHGLDEYDSEARWYYPAIMRTTTMDPMCEKYYSISPYAWCGNNPVNYVDPDGMDWYFMVDSLGGKTYHYREDVFCQQDLKDLNINGTYIGMTTEDENYYYGLFGYYYQKETKSAQIARSIDKLLIGDAMEKTNFNTTEDFGSYKVKFVVDGVNFGEKIGFNYAGGDGVYQQVIMNKLYLEEWYDEETSYSGWMDKGQKGFYMHLSNTSLSTNSYYPITINFKTAEQSAKIHRLYKKTVLNRKNNSIPNRVKK